MGRQWTIYSIAAAVLAVCGGMFTAAHVSGCGKPNVVSVRSVAGTGEPTWIEGRKVVFVPAGVGLVFRIKEGYLAVWTGRILEDGILTVSSIVLRELEEQLPVENAVEARVTMTFERGNQLPGFVGKDGVGISFVSTNVWVIDDPERYHTFIQVISNHQ